MNPLLEYNLYIKEQYRASVGEWEDWAERIVECLQAEMMAAENDYERYKKLETENAKLKREIMECVVDGSKWYYKVDREKLDALLKGGEDD